MHLNEAKREFLSGYFSTHTRRPKTQLAYSSDLVQFERFAGKNLELRSIDGPLIERRAGHLREKKYLPASIRRKIVVLKVFFSYWVRQGEVRGPPFWRVKLNFGHIEQLPRTLTEAEMQSLLAQARRSYSVGRRGKATRQSVIEASSAKYRALRNLALVDLLFATGMRVGEISALDVKDFLVQEAVFRVQGKGGRNRLAFAVDEKTLRIQQEQQEHLRTRTRIETSSSALFLNTYGARLSTQGISNMLAQLRRDAGIERHITPHMLRHTVATLLLRNGVDIRVVQEFLGHASIVTTQRYTHISKEHLISVLRQHHPSLRLRP
jgi:integrase/recombinase XerD